MEAPGEARDLAAVTPMVGLRAGIRIIGSRILVYRWRRLFQCLPPSLSPISDCQHLILGGCCYTLHLRVRVRISFPLAPISMINRGSQNQMDVQLELFRLTRQRGNSSGIRMMCIRLRKGLTPIRQTGREYHQMDIFGPETERGMPLIMVIGRG